ncbi:hypothetical protein [Amycolatopsis tucumanensis]|uniref:Uncharacterized protein n=1 Tax=Amycolatopsis tucumanensis TaxID=401106 RepID=A0ABP7JEZ0_9PSEU
MGAFPDHPGLRRLLHSAGPRQVRAVGRQGHAAVPQRAGVLLDDNNRKPVARLWFNRSQKYLGVFDENKVETRIPIESSEDIYQHADHLRTTVRRYLGRPVAVVEPGAGASPVPLQA